MEEFVGIFIAHIDNIASPTHVLVDIYGSDANICGTISMKIVKPGDREIIVDQLYKWMSMDTPLVLTIEDDDIQLREVDEAS